MKFGASTRSFGGRSIKETAEIFASAGLSCCELCFCQNDLHGWKYNLCGYSELPPVREVKQAIEIFAEKGIEVSALGVYNSYRCESPVDFTDSARLFAEYCNLAYETGVKILATHTGTTAFRVINPKENAEVFEKLCCGFLLSCIEAEKYGLTIGTECGICDILSNFEGFLSLKEHINNALGRSNMLKYIAVPSGVYTEHEAANTVLFHLKDRKKDGRYYERYGDGDVDFSDFFDTVRGLGDIPVILEYVNSENLLKTMNRIRSDM